MKKTILIIEHRLEDVLHREVDRVIVINDGRIIADMNAHELVCSDVLIQNGIREPLYVTAMKYAKIKVKPEMKPGHIWSLETQGVNQALRKWNRSVHAPDHHNRNASIIKIDNLSFSYDGLHPTLTRILTSICVRVRWFRSSVRTVPVNPRFPRSCAVLKRKTRAACFTGA